MAQSWSDLTDFQQTEALEKRYKLGISISELAEEYDINPITLNRRLQEAKRRDEAGEDITPADEREKVTLETEDENNLVISSQSTRITNLDELIAACKVDLETWAIDHYIVNTWEAARKAVQKSLTWEGGVIGGFVEDGGGFNTTPLYQVKVWLVRKQPVAVEPVISKVVITPLPITRSDSKASGKVKTSLVIPDMHIGFERSPDGKLLPFHDRKAMDIVLQAADWQPLDNIILLGDALDLPDWSDKFANSPDFGQNTQPALEELSWFLWQLRRIQPSARMVLLEGNHEKRQNDLIIKHLPQAYHLRPAGVDVDYSAWRIPELLGLEALGVDWIGGYPNGTFWLEDDLIAVHGATLSAEKVVADSDVSVIFGHIHRFESATRTVYTKKGPQVITAYSPGFLGRMDGVVPGVKARQRWSQGFGIVYHAHGLAEIRHVPISNGRAVFGGIEITGVDYSKELSRQIKGYIY